MDTIKQVTKKLQRATAEAIKQFSMIEAGDRIMVCLSGGKDSYTLLDMDATFSKSSTHCF
ncbi:hypothetical protein [Siansivirga zeaxanthinifaciens]|uniref:hypothetical protein n=1 Tax=Siansivirga zeaxanthinifaciens TaxID=762954 RepID=UPI000A43DF6B|nr:hypothetical protein [Siansivirga zeaxanthinifaciens]